MRKTLEFCPLPCLDLFSWAYLIGYNSRMMMKNFSLLFLTVCITANAFRMARIEILRSSYHVSAINQDKIEVEEYFNNEGFNRWNKIYSESSEVNKVQLDIRSGHQQTIDKVLNWIDSENNSKKTVCDAGCGVGSLALPMAKKFKKVFASDIASSMTTEAAKRAKAEKLNNLEFKVSDLENLSGTYDSVTCIDVMIHYPTDKMYDIVKKLCSISKERLILSFAPKNIFYDILKKIGELFPGKSKTTRAYLHPEEEVLKALKLSGFKVQRSEMTSTNFYFSRLLEAVRE